MCLAVGQLFWSGAGLLLEANAVFLGGFVSEVCLVFVLSGSFYFGGRLVGWGGFAFGGVGRLLLFGVFLFL